MQVFGRQDNMVPCARCGAENYPFASFCIACGEPFDEVADVDWPPDSQALLEAAASPHEAEDSSLLRNLISKIQNPKLLKRRETIIGLVLVLLVVGYVIFDWQRTMVQSAAYKDGIAAEQNKDWDRAAQAFEQAGGHRDADSKAHNARVEAA